MSTATLENSPRTPEPPAVGVPPLATGSAEVTKVRIARCTYNGAWWASHVGRIITVLFTDQYGHWTRDTEKPGADGMDGYRFLQWVKPEDCEPLSEEPNTTMTGAYRFQATDPTPDERR